jgi:hypothetical protein
MRIRRQRRNNIFEALKGEMNNSVEKKKKTKTKTKRREKEGEKRK